MKEHRNQSDQNLSASEQQRLAAQSAQDFADSDEILRFDAAQTIVPPEVAQRLQQSLGGAPAKGGAWWKKLLGL